MRQSILLIEALKKSLKHKGLRYKDLAERLHQSEANIKRIFSHKTLSLQKLEEICGVAGISIQN